jgi:hypothetical protein
MDPSSCSSPATARDAGGGWPTSVAPVPLRPSTPPWSPTSQSLPCRWRGPPTLYGETRWAGRPAQQSTKSSRQTSTAKAICGGMRTWRRKSRRRTAAGRPAPPRAVHRAAGRTGRPRRAARTTADRCRTALVGQRTQPTTAASAPGLSPTGHHKVTAATTHATPPSASRTSRRASRACQLRRCLKSIAMSSMSLSC